ncbi:MAG: hypothetical protein KF814_03980 [Nitrospiraceae bacterium]|nr:hypothetical protein [Nitrospiraceae bacterium]
MALMSRQAFSPYSWTVRARSAYHGFWFHLSERIRWTRRPYREQPAGRLTGLEPWQARRIAVLASRYGVAFEALYSERIAIANYHYLDILDRSWTETRLSPPKQASVTDVGCANFWYARTLWAFLHPARLVGVDLEGYRLYPSGYSRYDAAAGYLTDLPDTTFCVEDYCRVEEQSDLITAWFPFVTPAPVLAWRLPLSVLQPERLISRIAGNLSPGGLFYMVNQGDKEAATAHRFCRAAGLQLVARWKHPHPLRARPLPPIVSWWTA